MTIARQQYAKHMSVSTDTHATTEKLLEAVLSVLSVPRLYNETLRVS
jgi:hypothetical protein